MREMRFPIKLRFSGSGHLYSAILASSCYLHHCRANAHVRTTAAKVATQSASQLLWCRMRMFVQKSLTSDYEARRAKAALLGIIINERLLHRMQLVAIHQSLDCRNRLPLRLEGQHGARVNGFAVHNDSAGAAACAIAHTLCTGQFQFVPQRVEQRHAGLDFSRILLRVNIQRDWNLSRAVYLYVLSCNANCSRADYQRHRKRNPRDLQKASA